jgi:hypothetical protein
MRPDDAPWRIRRQRREASRDVDVLVREAVKAAMLQAIAEKRPRQREATDETALAVVRGGVERGDPEGLRPQPSNCPDRSDAWRLEGSLLRSIEAAPPQRLARQSKRLARIAKLASAAAGAKSASSPKLR